LTSGPLSFIEHPERLPGLVVYAADGRIGVVVEASEQALLVRRRRLMLVHRSILIPALAVDRIDLSGRTVRLNRTRREVSRIPQPKGSRPSAWFIPASMRIASTSPVIGVEPPSREEDEAEK
jgi:hypothetical protein